MRLAITALIVATAVWATAGIEHTILHGVSVRGVRVGVGPDQIPGLPEADLKSLVESRLQDSGIAFSTDAPSTLWINVTAVDATASACFVHLEARLMEDARLERNGFLIPASSWSRSAIATTSQADCAQRTTEAAGFAVDDFLEMYHAMNPAP